MTVNQSQPTRYLIQDRHLSLDNRFLITDDSGVVHYKVNSKFLSMGDKLLICDANGKELIKVHQEHLHLHLTYKVFSIDSGTTEHEIASVKRTRSSWHHKLEIHSVDGEYILQKKDGASSNEFTLTKDDQLVALATNDTSPTKSLYWVDIIDNREETRDFVVTMFIIFCCAQRLPFHFMTKPHTN